MIIAVWLQPFNEIASLPKAAVPGDFQSRVAAGIDTGKNWMTGYHWLLPGIDDQRAGGLEVGRVARHDL